MAPAELGQGALQFGRLALPPAAAVGCARPSHEKWSSRMWLVGATAERSCDLVGILHTHGKQARKSAWRGSSTSRCGESGSSRSTRSSASWSYRTATAAHSNHHYRSKTTSSERPRLLNQRPHTPLCINERTETVHRDFTKVRMVSKSEAVARNHAPMCSSGPDLLISPHQRTSCLMPPFLIPCLAIGRRL